MTIAIETAPKGDDGGARLPVSKCPVFLVFLESGVISVSTPTGGIIARWQDSVQCNRNPDQAFNLQGKSVRMQVAVEGGIASKVTFSSEGHQAEVPVPAKGSSDIWGRIKPDGKFSFSAEPDHS